MKFKLSTLFLAVLVVACGCSSPEMDTRYGAYCDQILQEGGTPEETVPDDFVPDWEHEADFNMPNKAELTEPEFFRDDIVVDIHGDRWRVTDVCWCRSRKLPGGGYSSYSRDGWWYRCKPEKAAQQQDDHKYIHQINVKGAP